MIEKQVPGQLEFEWPPRLWVDPELGDQTMEATEIDEELLLHLGRVSIL